MISFFLNLTTNAMFENVRFLINLRFNCQLLLLYNYKQHPNKNQFRTSDELCTLLEGMSRPQALCSQSDFD